MKIAGIIRGVRFDGCLVLCLTLGTLALRADNVGVSCLSKARLADILRQNAETNAPCNACAIVYRVDGRLAASVGVGGIGPDSAYAPGSVVKPLVAMTAFDLGIASADTSVSTNVNDPKYGKLPSDGSRVWLPELTVGQALVRSSNVVFGRLGMQIGLEALLSSYSKFGIGSRIGGLLSEASVAMPARIACGHDMLSTPDEIARAYVVLANRGKSPWTGIQIVSTNAVDEYLPYLARVATTEGTARRAAVKGVVVAGKTGTSQRVVDGRYASGLFDATFVGYYPAHSPHWIILTFFQNASPSDGLRQGGGRPALAFADIVRCLEGASSDQGAVIKDRQDGCYDAVDARLFELYQQGAASGNARAMTNLGLSFKFGRGVEKNEALGVEWLRKAAAKGDTLARETLAILCGDEAVMTEGVAGFDRRVAEETEVQKCETLIKQKSCKRAGALVGDLGDWIETCRELALRSADDPIGASESEREYKQEYKVLYFDSRYLSFGAEEYWYEGGAHGSTKVSVGVLDRKTGKRLKLDDLIPHERLSKLNQCLYDAVVKRLGSKDKIQGEVHATENFYIKDGLLHFVYNQYEIACYAEGQIDVSVPFPFL